MVHPRAVASYPHAPRRARQVRVDMSLFALMRQFEKGRSHMALVVDPVRPRPGPCVSRLGKEAVTTGDVPQRGIRGG